MAALLSTSCGAVYLFSVLRVRSCACVGWGRYLFSDFLLLAIDGLTEKIFCFFLLT